mmetsp:Transcript_9763/g.14519  ORF Transcript_9763/g.14519 Transcript_9763/m.14519 type:complete len:536 (+) Transcript_9763:143-1750(+)|eukprot:CAMPEP_0203674542 /NCGR_PEP_ID=MMETSP0090-20130426/16585_1 /ASSEMBLY_ACC=CAM_ASM_001088 /TAXON_ID=426623 /ORGANISM="Chaetoceros affinis, Strain CCMP159" /LENGTH=535 /DNA_ID=CAMNT_0050540451 /DNA_START=64 /DNA_END=1671 /DNA_ORIENTATION=-
MISAMVMPMRGNKSIDSRKGPTALQVLIVTFVLVPMLIPNSSHVSSCILIVSALVPTPPSSRSHLFNPRSRAPSQSRSRSQSPPWMVQTVAKVSSSNNNEQTSTITSTSTSTSTEQETNGSNSSSNNNMIMNRNDQRDLLISRAAKLRQSIAKQQAELMDLEQKIECSTNGYYFPSFSLSSAPTSISSASLSNMDYIGAKASTTMTKFVSSANVLKRKLERVHQKIGPNNKRWSSVSEYFFHELASGVRIVGGIVQKPEQIQHLIDPSTPTLIPHVPAILSRLDKLEDHVEPILERVLNNRQHLYSVEPYLDEILERFDDIEPHLPWILDNIDVLAPNTGLLLKHIDALLLFAESNEKITGEENTNIGTNVVSEYGVATNIAGSGKEQDDKDDDDDAYSLANQLLPYLEYYVSNLDIIGPHLVLLRPHVPLLLKHNRIAKISPHIDKLFARGYKDLGASANLDILLFWFGWSLQVPFLPALFFSLPFSPRLVTFLANRLPKKFARKGKGYCRRLRCVIDDDYGDSWNKLESRSSA